jgi:hypothetical protein
MKLTPTFGSIAANHATQRPTNILFFDTETRPVELEDGVTTRHDLHFGVTQFVSYRNTRGGWQRPQQTVFDTPTQFWDEVEARSRPNTVLYVFAHNLGGFDFNVVGAHRALLDRGWELGMTVIECPPFILEFKMESRTILLLDSLNYTRDSLANIGRSMGLPKGEDPGVWCTKEERLDYCVNDVDILRKFMCAFIDFTNDNDLGNFANTGASQAMHAWRHRFAPTYVQKSGRTAVKVFPTRGPDFETLERAAYYAGRVGADTIGDLQDIHYVDVNSLFPSVMLQEKFPYQLRGQGETMSLPQLRALLGRGEGIIAEVTLCSDKDWYPMRGEERLLFPVGTFTTTLATPEIQLALDEGQLLSVGKWQSYLMADLFSEYINYFYQLRLRFKAEGNGLWEYICKVTFLNSLYGKFGQKAPEWVEDDTVTWPEHDHLGRPTGYLMQIDDIEYRRIGYTIERKLEDSDRGSAKTAFVAIACHVTSHARLRLLEGIRIAGRENCHYHDTDSIFLNEKGYQNLHDAGLISPGELGKWKLESVGADKLPEPGPMTIRGLKDYTFKGQTKIKGINRRAKQINENTFEQEQFTSYAGSLRRKTDGTMTTRKMTKTLTRIYTKGTVPDGGGRVSPLRMQL